MEGIVVLLVLLMLGVPIGLTLWLVSRAVQSRRDCEELSRRLRDLERELHLLKRERPPAPSPARPTSAEIPATMPERTEMPVVSPTPPPPKPATPPPVPSPGFAPLFQKPAPAISPALAMSPVGSPAPAPTPAPPPRPALPAINWEQFMGVKLFAWLGGLALFLGVVFFVKYSFEHNLIPPELRVAIGFVTGLGLLVGGVVLHRRQQYVVGAQALCATGVVILYAVTYACRFIYHFEFFGPIPTFLLMVLVTTTAFFVAVRLDALVVAILGMLGGFLTPILISTGVDNPLGLFGYIAVLDVGLLLVAQNRRWFFLTALAAAGTALMQCGWASEFFVREKYFEGGKILIALGVLLGFNALYLAATWWSKKKSVFNWWLAGGTLGLAGAAFAFTAWFFSFESLAHRPWLLFSFLLLIDLGVTAVSLLEKKAAPAQLVAGLVVFGLLAAWTSDWLRNDLLNAALAAYLVFAALHTAFPLVRRKLEGATGPLWAAQIFPPLALLLVLIPIFKLAAPSFVVWPFVLLVDLLAIALAVVSASLLSVVAVLLLTLLATAGLIFKIPPDLTGLPFSFTILGAFAVFFVVASVWLLRKFKPEALARPFKLGDDLNDPSNLATLLPACSATLPFLLLIMATLRLPLTNPSPVFGLALLLLVLLLGLTKLFSLDWLPAVSLACVSALECAWHFQRFERTIGLIRPDLSLTWYLVFLGVFAVFPFLFLKQFSGKVIPFATAALAGLPQFFLLHRLVKLAYPDAVMGLLPAAFALPALLSLVIVLKRIPADNPARLSQLACFGGVALFFITLIFPIQFDKQWITIGWALEGAALLWLFHRVPHPGLRLTGFGLLVAAFVRLALNPEVLQYHSRTNTPVLNWYLYAYGIVTVCLFAGARLLAPPRHLILKSNVPPILVALGTVLAFLLLNIEIADYFSAPGARLTFQFSGNFARDMTYSIAWGLFALTLLVIGIAKDGRPARYAALGLLVVTLLKLFFHDLAHLNQLYRIGAFIGVSVILILASFAYQRFYATSRREETKHETAP